MVNSRHRVDTIMALWDHLDNATLYVPTKKQKDSEHYNVLVTEDPEHNGLYMLRVFLSKEDVNDYLLSFGANTFFQKMNLELIEFFMQRYTNPLTKHHIKMSRCILTTVDIDRNLRDIEVIWQKASS